MIRRVIVEPAADADIDEQALYFSQQEGDTELAARFFRAAQDTFDRLAENPGIGVLCRFDSPRLSAIRMHPIRGFENSLVFYTSSETEIRIMRVLHGARNIKRILEDEL